MQVPFDYDSASSDEEHTKDGKSSIPKPNVLDRVLPTEKFSFLDALSER